jgi:hypothetical protein
MPSQSLPGITATRLLIVVLALAAAGLAMWRVRSMAPAPETPYFPPGHMQIAAPAREAEPSQPDNATKAAGQQAQPAGGQDAASAVSIAPTSGEVQTALSAWRLAWESRDVESYLSFYHPDFPNRDGFYRQKNGVMVRAKGISVDLQNVQVTLEPQRARVVFLQHYKSDTFESRDLKVQVWVQGTDGPKILQEFSRSRRDSENE